MSSLVLEERTRVWTEAASEAVGVEVGTGEVIGGGPDTLELVRQVREAVEEYFKPASRQLESVRQRFDRLAVEWKEATMFVSSTTEICTHPAYQQIIGLGPQAIPLLLERLDREPDHWFWALRVITGINPTRPADSGQIRKMADAWLCWGREQGYLS